MTRIYITRTQLGITELGSGIEQPAELPFRPTKPIDIDDSEVVGFDADKDKIICHLLDKNISRRTVLSIVGVGGLGKTTLASKVYQSDELNVEFPCRTWLSISQSFDATKVCRKILYLVEPKMKDKSPPDEEVWEELKKSLNRKRYLIVLDDVWTTDLWERLKKVIPNNNNASRVIIATRNLDIALASDRETEHHNLRYLTEDESLTLLFRKAQQDVQLGKYPSHLVDVAKKLIEKCGRLPLALVVLGRVLGTKPSTYISWMNVYKTLDWHLNDEVKKCTQTLCLSYQELSYEQKQRFLYFAAFPEDHQISSKHIIRLWIAERLISVDGEGTMEERAEDYLEDLVKRCLVQVIEKSWSDDNQYCGMHDLLRDLAIHEAKKENFFTVFSKTEDGSQHATKEMHRVALQLHTPTGYNIHSTNIHSLLCFGGSTVPSDVGFATQLRVLVIENIDFRKVKVGNNWLANLVHMRYLGFRNCIAIEKIVDNTSFSSMKNLETFDSYKSWTRRIYDTLGPLWEVTTLRHVIFDRLEYVPGPPKWDNLKNLQTLKWVVLKDIPKLEINFNLRTLKIMFSGKLESPKKSRKALQVLLSRAENLISLHVIYRYSGTGRFSWIFNVVGMRQLPCYETIQSLYIGGSWESGCIPSLEVFPKYLTKLRLTCSCLKEDPMPILEMLPNLIILRLVWAYDGEKMVRSTGGFPKLQILMLRNLFELNEWEIEEGAMPFLSKLTINACTSFSPFPKLQNVTSLQELIVSQYLLEEKERLLSEDLYKIKHIPSVRFDDPDFWNGEEDDGEDDSDKEEEDSNDAEEEEDDGEGNNDDDDSNEGEDEDDDEGEDDD